MKLTLKQDNFVKAYLLNGGNGTQAAISAGYSKKTASVTGCENLTKPNIARAIEEHKKMKLKSHIWSKEDKLERLQTLIESCSLVCAEKGALNANAAISGMKEHNLMMGHNAPTEIIQDTSVSEIVLKVIC